MKSFIQASLIAIIINFTVSAQTANQESVPQLGKSPLKEVIAAMTPEE